MVLSDLVQIRRMGEKKLDENQRFRHYLKRHQFSEQRLKKLAEDTADAFNCRACANCCRVATTRLKDRDIEHLSRTMRLTRERFLCDYATETDDEGWILKRTEAGCTFLSGNDCLIYEDRPDACRQFPHLVRGTGSFLSRMWEMPDRATYCPIVYNALEAFKQETGFQR